MNEMVDWFNMMCHSSMWLDCGLVPGCVSVEGSLEPFLNSREWILKIQFIGVFNLNNLKNGGKCKEISWVNDNYLKLADANRLASLFR